MAKILEKMIEWETPKVTSSDLEEFKNEVLEDINNLAHINITKFNKIYSDIVNNKFKKVFNIDEVLSEIIVDNNIKEPYTFTEKTITIKNPYTLELPLFFKIVNEENTVILENTLNEIPVTFNITNHYNWELLCNGEYEVNVIVTVVS